MKFRTHLSNAFGVLAIFAFIASLFSVAAGTICGLATGKCIVLVVLCVLVALFCYCMEEAFRK